MKPTVRTIKACLAGLGTSGSLLAGAAVLFVLGSAIVAFRGWPQISTGPASVVVAAASRPGAPSRVARRLAAALRNERATGGAALAPASGRRVVTRTRRTERHGTARIGSPVTSARPGGSSVAPSGSSATAVSAGGPSTPTCGSACGGGPGTASLVSQATSTVSQATNTVSQAVSNLGSSVGSGVSAASSTVGGAVNGVSPQAGNAVQNVGNSVGNTVAGTSTTAANVLSQAGSALSGGH